MDRFKQLIDSVLPNAYTYNPMPTEVADIPESWGSADFWEMCVELSKNTNLTSYQTDVLLNITYLSPKNNKDYATGELFGKIMSEGQQLLMLQSSSTIKKWFGDDGGAVNEWVGNFKRLKVLNNILMFGVISPTLFQMIMPPNPSEDDLFSQIQIAQREGRNSPEVENRFIYDVIKLNPNLSADQIDYFLQLPLHTKRELEVNHGFFRSIAKSCILTDSQFERLFNMVLEDDKDILRRGLCRNSRLTPAQTEKLLNDSNSNKNSILRFLRFTDEQFLTFVETPTTHAVIQPNAIMKSPYAAFDGKTSYNRAWRRLVKNQFLTPEQSDLLYKTLIKMENHSEAGTSNQYTERYWRWVARRQHLTMEQFSELSVGAAISSGLFVENPNLSDEQIKLLLTKISTDADDIAMYGKFSDDIFEDLFYGRTTANDGYDSKIYLAVNPNLNWTSPYSRSGLFNWMW
tara:strand:- start:2237 stop:3613 length:1377 start_codon:yes stop_codon:yes gene_type:complete